MKANKHLSLGKQEEDGKYTGVTIHCKLYMFWGNASKYFS